MKRIALIFLLLCSTALASFDDSILKDSTNVTFEVLLRGDDDGMGETGETSATVTCSYMRQGAAAPVEVALIDGTLGSHADGGWVATSATLRPGEYQFHAPDAAFASGANAVTFMFTASGVLDKTVKFALVNYDPRDAVRMGMTALPNAAADAAGGLVISDAGGLDADAILKLTSTIDGVKTATNVLAEIYAVIVNKTTVADPTANPIVIVHRNNADDATVVTHTVAADGTGRTK